MFNLKLLNILIIIYLQCLCILLVNFTIVHSSLINNNNNISSNTINDDDINNNNANIRVIKTTEILQSVVHLTSNRTCEEFCETHSLNKLHTDSILNDSLINDNNLINNDNNNDPDISLIISNWLIQNRLKDQQDDYKNSFIEDYLKKSSIIFGISKTVNEGYVSRLCYSQLQEIKKAIIHKEIWGIKVLDSSGVKKPGFLWGNSFWFGSKEGCEAVQNPVSITLSNQLKRTMKMGLIGDLAPFAMEYRVVYIKHNSPWQVENKVQTEGIIHIGLCIPKSCSNNEIHSITQNYIEQDIYTETNLYEMNPQIINVKDLKIDNNFINKKSIKFLGAFLILTIIMFIFSGCLTENITTITTEIFLKNNNDNNNINTKTNNIKMNPVNNNSNNNNNNNNNINNKSPSIGKLRDLSPFRRLQSDESEIYKIIKCFDFVNNWKELFLTKDQDARSIPIINGIRSISCMWIICFHVAWYSWFTIDDQTFLVSNAERIFFQYISTSPLLVDVFFTISGFLLTYKFIKNEKEMNTIAKNNCGENFKILLDRIFHRYLRLAPPSFALIGIVEVFSAYSENVSIFHLHERNDQTCSKYWWRNFLFIQNFYNLDDMCLNWSWSLACEMQFFIATLILLFVYTKSQQKAKIIFVVGFIGTIIWSFIAGYKYQYQFSFDIAYKTRTHIYINPFLRVLPYYLGVGAGWYLAITKGEFDMTQKFEKRSWYLSLVIFFMSLYSTIKRDIGFLPTIGLMVVGRILFSLSVCWMIIGSATGRGVWWSRILECKIFQHVNKLSYCMYLINPLIIFIIFSLSSSTNHTDPIMMSVLTVGIIVIVYILSIFFSISFEMPYCNFSTFLLRRNKKKIT